MVTVAHLVQKSVEQRPFLEEALGRGIINYAALADMLLQDIERELGQKVRPAAIIMALRRFAEKLSEQIAAPAARFKKTDITIKSDLFEITIANSPTSVKTVQKLYDLVDISRGDFLTVTQGLYEITMIANKKYKKQIQKILSREKITNSIDGLASVTIQIAEESVKQVGLFYVITKALAWENIPITEIVSTFTEQTYVLKEEFVSRAFYAIKAVIANSLLF